MAVRLARALVSLVVPPLCAGCGEPELAGAGVCPSCRARLVTLSDPRCARCGAPSVVAVGRCPECRGRPLAFCAAWSPYAYEQTCKSIVHALKSRAPTAAAAFMGDRIAALAPAGLLEGTLVPAPAHAARRRREGFNQAEALARGLGGATGLPTVDVLRRAPGARRQVGLPRTARAANARDSVLARRRLPPGRVVVVDDVYTTGATLDACARALRGAGAEEVAGVTFARALRGHSR